MASVPITSQPYLTQPFLLGVAGLDLRTDLEQINPNALSRMSNWNWGAEGELVARYGLGTVFAQPSNDPSAVHSIGRLDDPKTTTFTRIWGIGTKLYGGQSGTLSLIESGFSGAPFVMRPWRPALSGQTYMYLANGTKMRKVSLDLTSTEIGLAAPDDAVTTEIATDLRKTIDLMESASDWTANNGGGSASVAADTSNKKQGAAAIKLTAAAGSATEGFNCYFCKPLNLDLSSIDFTTLVTQQGQTRVVDDEDNFHLWIRADKPSFLSEVRVYFVVSETFETDTIPGTSETKNTDAYMRTIRPSDATNFLELEAALFEGGEEKLKEVLLSGALESGSRLSADNETIIRQEQTEEKRFKSDFLAPGRAQWTEFGVHGNPLRRGSFLRIGSDTKRDWATVTGIVVAVKTIVAETVIVHVDDFYLHGGYAPDTSESGTIPYDYRYIHYDITTGELSNPSPIQDEADYLEPIRQAVRCYPVAYGRSSIRQRFYRRGGTLTNNWFLIGQNSSDGACGLDVKSDAQIQLAHVLETDNDQPVTTEKADGTAVYAQPLKVIWGPHNGILFGCGDPFRPGFLYWSKYRQAGAWPAANNEDVCPPAEELLAGEVFGGQSYVFSRARAYGIHVSIQGNQVGVAVAPTLISRGLVGRYALTVGREGIYFVARDGVFRTSGGVEQSITDERLAPLFNGITRNGYNPIDFNAADVIQLKILGEELHFTYQDTDGDVQHMIYSVIFNRWRHNSYEGFPFNSIAIEDQRETLALFVGMQDGRTFKLNSVNDNGKGFSLVARTGSLNQGLPRHPKRYGDVVIDMDRAGEAVTIAGYLDAETRSADTATLDSSSGRSHHIADIFSRLDDDEAREARNCAIEITATTTNGGRPRLYHAGISYIPLPEVVDSRITDWDFGGRGVDKRFKGLELDCDTKGKEKILDIEVDGKVVETIHVIADGRRPLQFSWPSFMGRLIRIRPREAVDWQTYSLRWIFDEQPLQLPRWETGILDHSLQQYHSIQEIHIKYKATAPVDVLVEAYQGSRVIGPETILTSKVQLPPTGGIERKTYFTPDALKGMQFRYIFTSPEPFHLYREESYVYVQPWGRDEALVAHPFGNDDLDLVRGLSTASVLANRPGGGRLTES